jgi:hypothetical protein
LLLLLAAAICCCCLLLETFCYCYLLHFGCLLLHFEGLLPTAAYCCLLLPTAFGTARAPYSRHSLHSLYSLHLLTALTAFTALPALAVLTALTAISAITGIYYVYVQHHELPTLHPSLAASFAAPIHYCMHPDSLSYLLRCPRRVLQFNCPIHCLTLTLFHCFTVYCKGPTVLLSCSYCPTVLLSYCPTGLLSHCPTILLVYYPTVLLCLFYLLDCLHFLSSADLVSLLHYLISAKQRFTVRCFTVQLQQGALLHCLIS